MVSVESIQVQWCTNKSKTWPNSKFGWYDFQHQTVQCHILYRSISTISAFNNWFFCSLVLFLWGSFRQDTQIVTDRYSGIRPSAVPDSQYSTDGEKGFFSTSIHEYLIPPIVLYVSSTKGPQNIYFIRPRENLFLGCSSPFPPY